MRQIVREDGYGVSSSAEIDDFSRIRLGHYRDNEEVRYDRPTAYTGTAYEYVAVAEANTTVASPLWNCVRCTWVNGHKVREQFRANIAWADRAIGW